MFQIRLKELRKQHKMSQLSLAKLLKISQQAVGKWETGRSTPDPLTLNQIADIFEVSVDYLLGRSFGFDYSRPTSPSGGEVMLPVIGTVKAGYGALAFQEDYGMEIANVKNAKEYFYLIVRGDSMEPRIHNGDLALVHRQPDVENGELAVILVENEEATLKKVIKKSGAVILQPFNQNYEAQVFLGEDIGNLQIVGKVIETKTKW